VGSKANSLLVYWHLLSLDAPTVATLWTWFIARTAHIQLSRSSLAAMATAVWMLYAADRLLDIQTAGEGELEARHYFHLKHRTAFLTGIAIASIVLALLMPTIPIEAMRLYLTLGGTVAGYFIVIHATRSAHRLPKEIAVGVCFAAAVFIPTVARAPYLRLPLVGPALLFAALCSLNCLFIYAWEHPTTQVQTLHVLTAAAMRHLVMIGTAVAMTGVVLATVHPGVSRPLYLAIAIAASALLFLHRSRLRYGAVTLRASADLVLLTPALLGWFV